MARPAVAAPTDRTWLRWLIAVIVVIALAAGLTAASFLLGRESGQIAEPVAPADKSATAQPTKTETDATAMSVLKAVGISNAKDIDIEIMTGRPAVLRALTEARKARDVFTSIPRLERQLSEAQEAYDNADKNLDTMATVLKGKSRVSTDTLRSIEGLRHIERDAKQRLNEAKDRLNEARRAR